MTSQPPFVGRTSEIEEFENLLESARTGHGRLLLVAGHPGVGKTSTALAFRELAEDRGFAAVWAGFPEQADCPPYWAWIRIVTQLAGMGFTEVSDLSEYFDRRAVADHERTRSWLFDRTLEALRKVSSKRRLAIFIDDLQCADIASGALIQLLAGAIADQSILLTVTYRDADVARPDVTNRMVAAMSSAPFCRRLVLRGMDIAECAQLTHALSGWMPEADILRRLHRQTEGNPLFLRHIVQSLIDQGHIGTGAIYLPAGLTVPEGIREAIGFRLDRASAPCIQMLRLAAILGRNFTLPVLERISQGYEPSLIDEAAALQLVRPVEAALGQWQFVHALIREVVYEMVPPMRRIRAHADAASAIEHIYGPEHPQMLASLAYHSFEGQLFVGTRQVIERAGKAGRHAMSVTAYEDAANQFRLALECYSVPGVNDEAARIDLALALAEAECAAGDIEGAMETCRNALKHARRIEDWNRYAAVALQFEDSRWRLSLPGRESIGYLVTALEHSGSEDTANRARMLYSLALAHGSEGQQSEAEEHGAAAVAIARRIGDDRLLCDTLGFSAAALYGPETLAKRLKMFDEQLQIARRCGDANRLATAYYYLIVPLAQAGRFPEAARLLEEFRPLVYELSQPHLHYIVTQCSVVEAMLRGDFQRAATLASEALETSRRIKGSRVEGLYGIQMFLIHRERGLLSEFAELALEKAGAAQYWQPGYALLLAEGGKLGEAAASLEEFDRDGLDTLPRDDLRLMTLGFMAETCAFVGNLPLAARLYEKLEPANGLAIACGPSAACMGPVDRLLGRLKACTGAYGEAREWFEKALAQSREWNSPPMILRIACDYAEALLADGSPAALKRARELEHEAGQDARLAGMRSIAERFDTISRKLREMAMEHGFDNLTAREIEVLRLLAAGASNAEISSELDISITTVATHVRNILSKTDCRNRTAAAAYARQNGLLFGEPVS